MNKVSPSAKRNFVSTRNSCALCAPLGAAFAFRGIESCIPVIHGSQGCSTYIRRYLISHFREPVDIASSNFSEDTAVFGGSENLKTALDNVIRKYRPSVIGVASTCLSETIGDDIPLALREYRASGRGAGTELVHVSTPSYRGIHSDGYRGALRSLVETLSCGGDEDGSINIILPMMSPEDLRHIAGIASDFGLDATMLPDYSDTLDGQTWDDYRGMPEGGTPVGRIRGMGRASATIEIGSDFREQPSAGAILEERFGVSLIRLALPLGIDGCDSFFKAMEKLSGRPSPAVHIKERGRLVDAYIDGHKYLSGKRAIIYGEPDMIDGLGAFLSEIGITTVLCATGARTLSGTGSLMNMRQNGKSVTVSDDTDFSTMLEMCRDLKPDIVIGNSKGYFLSKRLGIPLVRVGFPIHDRFGGQRLMHTGYRGTLQLFDRIVNAVIEQRQVSNTTGYSYI